MKQTIKLTTLVLCTLVFLALCVACAVSTDGAGNTAGAEQTPNGSGDNDDGGVPHPLSLEADIGITAAGTWYPILQDASGLLSALGDDYEFYSAPSCAFIGEDKEFLYANCAVYTNPDGDTDIWYLIAILDSSLETSRGIKIGDTLQQVFDAYGDRYYWDDSETELTYSISGIEGDITSPCIILTFENDTVSLIEIYYPTGEA